MIATEKLSEHVGAAVLDVDLDRLRDDDELPDAVMEALERHGVLLFRELHADDDAQVAFCRKLGPLMRFPAYKNPEVMEISFAPDNPNREYLASNDYWHIDGFMDAIPAKASIMTAHQTADKGGETEFASTYVAYEKLTDAEKATIADLRVWHSFETIQRLTYPDPSDAQRDEWARRGGREHPLVWNHHDGRRSLVFGAAADHVVGWEDAESRALIDDLTTRATAPDRVLRHTWSVGDMVMWDNRGLVHRACEFDRTQPRRMHRTTLVGDEPIQ